MNRRTFLRAAGLLVTALVAAAVGVGLTGPDQSPKSTLVGYFADASPLDPGSQIRLAGVNVGSVDRIALHHGRARVTFEVDPSLLPLHEDASMVIRPVNLLGESYVELQAGTPSKPYLKSVEIPAHRTSTRVTLEDVLNTFDDPTSTALATLVTTLGEGLRDAGPQAAAALKALGPAMRDSQKLARLLDEQNAVLIALVEHADPVARALAADHGAVLDRTVESTERTLSTVSANKAALQDILTELPQTLDSARRTLRILAGTAEATTPTLREMRPLTDDLGQIAREIQEFGDAAAPALASLKPVLQRADELLDQAGPAVAELRKAGPNLRGVARDLRPLGETVLDRNLSDLMEFIKKWALSTNGRDALGNYFRGVAWVTPDTLNDTLGSPLPASSTGSSHEGTTGSSPNLPSMPLPDLGTPSGGAADPNNATGLSEQQEQSLLGQFLGGL